MVEKELQTYLDAGFDGWILKPIDFKRLSVLLDGIVHEETRASCLYEPGEWERGGWFEKRSADLFSVSTNPSKRSPTAASSSEPTKQIRPEDDSTDKERERLESLQTDAVHADSTPEHRGESENISTSTLESIARPP